MNLNIKAISLFTFFIAVFSSNVFAGINLSKELSSDKVVVLVINANEHNKSEQYADWSHYLNQFSRDVGNKYIFHKISSKRLGELIENSGKFEEKYSIIFMQKNKPSYFYKGAILEPQVYEYIKLSFEGKPIEPEYLKQFAPQKVKIKLKKCHHK